MIRRFSLQLKLVFLVSILTVCLTGIIIAFDAKNLRNSVQETYASQLTGMTIAINGRYEESHSKEDVQQIFDYIQIKNPKALILTLHGNKGKITVSTDRNLINTDSPSYIRSSLQDDKTLVERLDETDDVPMVRLTAPLKEDGHTVGVIELVLDASDEATLIQERLTSAIIIGSLCGILFLIVLWFSLRKLMVNPLLRLRQAAIEVKREGKPHKLELRASQELMEVADAFNEMVEDLDTRYRELQNALHTIQETQEQLVQSEKMVALGRLVAGIAHEINTPIGIGVTAASYLEQKTKEFVSQYEQNKMKKSDLDTYLRSIGETMTMIQSNLRRAAELIKSFKQVSVDQSSEQKRTFRIVEYIEDTVRSLQPTIKKSKQKVAVFGSNELEVNSYPGALSQIVTNFIMNSLIHAYQPEDEGYMMVKVEQDANRWRILYADDGRGMSKEVADKIFDPFFTTNRGGGGTGLGMHIVYNLVTQKLGGTIQCVSEPGKGTTFIIDIPFAQEEPDEQQSA